MLGLYLLLSVWYISSGFPLARTLVAKMVPALLQLLIRSSAMLFCDREISDAAGCTELLWSCQSGMQGLAG